MEFSDKKCVVGINKIVMISVFLLFILSFYIVLGFRKIIPLQKYGIFFIILSFCISYLMTPVMCIFARKTGIIDYPSERKMHKKATPLLGGISIYLAFGIGVISTLWYSSEYKGIVYAATIIFVVGLLDDIFELSSIVRLLVQIAAVFVLFYHKMVIDFIPDPTSFRIFEKIITLIWIIGITNAVNFLDGLDGLCVGFGAIAAFFFGIIALLTSQYFLMFLAFSLSGSCLGFLPWNFRHGESAKIFMGDAGSMFIGFTLASFAIMGNWAENKVVGLAVPILILFLPIFDITMTTFLRIRDGEVKTFRQWIDYVGKDHFHHRLYEVGIGKWNAVWTMYTVTIMLGFSAIIIRTGGFVEAYLALLQACVVLVGFTVFMNYVRKRYDSITSDSVKLNFKGK